MVSLSPRRRCPRPRRCAARTSRSSARWAEPAAASSVSVSKCEGSVRIGGELSVAPSAWVVASPFSSPSPPQPAVSNATATSARCERASHVEPVPRRVNDANTKKGSARRFHLSLGYADTERQAPRAALMRATSPARSPADELVVAEERRGDRRDQPRPSSGVRYFFSTDARTSLTRRSPTCHFGSIVGPNSSRLHGERTAGPSNVSPSLPSLPPRWKDGNAG